MNESSSPLVGFRLSVMMFLQFFVWGAWYVTTGPYMKEHGLESVIYWAYTVGPIAAILSPFFLGMVADRFFSSERVLAAMQILGGVFIALAPMAARHKWEWVDADGAFAFLREGPFIGMLLLHMLCYMPTLGLTNTVAFHAMTAPEKQFPLVRVWGTIGWIVAGLTVSKLGVDKADRVFAGFGDMPLGQYQLAGAAAILLGLYSLTLPHTPPPAKGKPFSVRDALGLDALALLKRTDFAVFIAASLLVCIPLAAYYAFAGTFVGAQGVEGVGSVMSRGQMSEIFFMLVMPFFFVRLGVKWMLAVGMLAWVVRYALFTWAAGMPQAEWTGALAWLVGDPKLTMPIFLGILLHGICYDFFFVTGFIYTERVAPKALRASAQGFLVLITQGVGMLLGAQISGMIFNRVTTDGSTDWRTFWLVPAVMALAILLLFVAAFRERPAASSASEAGTSGG
ncbi:MAG: MFS transporter [Phycisphaerales bacterium]|nr:MFS transporter [Phycisphaerales bacterium]